jgi:hypothetical protein
MHMRTPTRLPLADAELHREDLAIRRVQRRPPSRRLRHVPTRPNADYSRWKRSCEFSSVPTNLLGPCRLNSNGTLGWFWAAVRP